MSARPYVTGFCGIGRHQSCPVVVRQPAGDRATPCTCGCHLETPPAGIWADAQPAAPRPVRSMEGEAGDRTGTAQ